MFKTDVILAKERDMIEHSKANQRHVRQVTAKLLVHNATDVSTAQAIHTRFPFMAEDQTTGKILQQLCAARFTKDIL